MATWSQENHSLGIETPLGADELVLFSIEGSDLMSGLFHYSLLLASENATIDPTKLVGKNVDIWIRLEDGGKRYINGYVKTFSRKAETVAGYAHYSAEIVPWLWFLGKTSDCRIFQNKSVKDVIEAILNKDGNAQFEFKLHDTYQQLEYCVQYLETNLDFVHRLMNQVGMYYYFTHDKGAHKLIISDHHSGYISCQEAEIIHTEGHLETAHLSNWQENYEFFSGRWVQTDYNYEDASKDLTTTSDTINDLPNTGQYPLFNYPGDYKKTDAGSSLTDIRMEREEQNYQKISAKSDYRSLQAGTIFTLKDHDFSDLKSKKFTITRISHQAFDDTYSNSSSGRTIYRNMFEAIPGEMAYLESTTLGKPRIFGHQTAIVVGPSGEEIYTDKFGRIKVQFYWDRYGKLNEESSCWVRVSHTWAGKKWGQISLPRIGQEVVISFEDGDPDRPMIIGRVYNSVNMPPYELPANATISGLKSNTSKGGGGFNEIRMEDKKDSELLYLQAQKDMEILVKNDKSENIKRNRNEIVDKDHKEEIKGKRTLKITGEETKNNSDKLTLTVDKAVTETFKDKHTVKVTKDHSLEAENITLEAKTKITLKVGQSSITIESGGITLKTTADITLNATGQLKMKGTGGATLESSASVKVQGSEGTIDGGGMLTIKGGMVKIN